MRSQTTAGLQSTRSHNLRSSHSALQLQSPWTRRLSTKTVKGGADSRKESAKKLATPKDPDDMNLEEALLLNQ